MRFNHTKATLKTAVLVATVLLLGASLTVAQQQINLTAGPATATLPDGSTVPMWGYSCNATQVAGSTATCASLNPAVTAATPTLWSPVVITIPYTESAPGVSNTSLTINLTNNLQFGANGVPTSLTIVGQLGGGLGAAGAGCTGGATCTTSPDHSGAQSNVTWPIAAPGGGTGTPPAQGPRVQSFGAEVSAVAATTTPTCSAPSAGPVSGCAVLTWSALRPGTYLIESGTHPSIQGPMGLYGILVVTTAPAGTTAGTAYGTPGTATAVSYNAEIPLLLSEIDPVQNTTVSAAVNTATFSETAVWSGQPGGCGNPSSSTYLTCYPPAVNYSPLFYMINGVAFSKNNTLGSLFPATSGTSTVSPVTGTVLVRLVNAGLRMHVPSIVGSLTTPAVVATGITAAPVAGFSLVAEDGNPLPGVSRVQSEVFMAAGKTYDVMINVPAAPAPGTTATALPIFDRELSLSANATARDSGMLAYIGINNAQPPLSSNTSLSPVLAQANPDTYVLTPGVNLTVSDPSRGVIANDKGVFIVELLTPPANGTVTLSPDGTFVYYPAAATTADTFTYCANGRVTGVACSSGITTTVTLGPTTVAGGITCTVPNPTYTSNVATYLAIKTPGLLAFCKDAANLPLSLATSSVKATGMTVHADVNGGFTAIAAPGGGTQSFTVNVQNPAGQTATVTAWLVFPTGSGLAVNVLDGRDKTTAVTDYRWVIEEDRTFHINPACTGNPPAAGCPTFGSTGIVPTFGTNFHTSYMPLVATGCTGPLSCEGGQTLLGQPAVCDIGNGVCRPDTTGNGFTQVTPDQVHLDPTRRYYLTIFPGDAANSFENAGGCLGNPTPSCGHGMGGAPVACVPTAPAVTCTASGTFPPVTVYVQPNPFPPSKLSVFVFEDDFPLNGEHDSGGGTGGVNTNHEAGLGQFNITLFDDAGGTGDATGQMTYDMFNQPLSNSLAGTIDPLSQRDACPISKTALVGVNASNNSFGSKSPTGITGTIVVCPEYEDDGVTPSPLAGQAVVANLMPGRYGVVATPGADRIGRGEEWLQTNTLDGQKAHDSFLRIGEPSSFQEYGPAGYHVSIGFANPKIINSRLAGVCAGTDPNLPQGQIPCQNTLTGVVTTERMSRTPDERLFSSGDNSSFAFTNCYVSFGDPDGEDFAFTKCASDGSFTLSGLPDGDWRVTVFDQWNDMLVDGLSTPVRLGGGTTTDLGQIATNQWQANIYTSTFFDANGNGVRDPGETGLTLVPTNIRFRDGSYSNFNNTDLSGNAGFNEVFPLFSWYIVETETTRFKTTGVHVVYDAGGPSDGSTCNTANATVCGKSNIAHFMANTAEQIPVPSALRVPGAYYCTTADCADAPKPLAPGGTGGSTGRVDPPLWFGTEGWQGFSGQNSFIEFGKKPYAVGETGGIFGEVIYASTRPFDDPSLLIHTSWTPDVPGVTINLYQEGVAADGVTPTLTLVDTTKTSSFDDWAQGFRSDHVPNMNCPGQGAATGTNADMFFFTLYNQPMWLDYYNSQHGGPAPTALPNNAQFKCYDGMHNWNQVQPAPYDGMYQFPSVTGLDPTTGKPTGTNCTICTPNPDSTDPYRAGLPMLPAGKYVVEMVVPPGYELVKEEDKNILIGDNYIAPVTQQFGALGGIFILPDQAAVGSTYNANNPNNPTQAFGTTTFPRSEGDTGSVETFWPCVGASRIVPDYISLFPGSGEVAPFAGATRNLCDRKEVTLTDQAAALAKFWIFTSAHVAAHFTGVITDDYTSEFDPFSPQFGEKFSPPNLPVSIKDWTGTEISRVYSDQWGTYDGLTYSTWEVNPPNPTGYAPTMMVTCMNDPGPIPGSNGTMVTDPLFDPQYSQFCYEIPFMPGQTQYMDTPVVPTTAFAGAGYNNPDCAYPDATPAISEVDGDGIGPWVANDGQTHTLTITALGDQMVPNYAYAGPSATTAPYNQKTVKRHYGFGSQNGVNGTTGSVTIGGQPATITSWSDTQIVVNVPSGVPACPIQQQTQYGGSAAQCGQLVITTSAVNTGGNVTGVSVGPPNNGSHNPGRYPSTAPPTITFSGGGGGSGAVASPNMVNTGAIYFVMITNGGAGFRNTTACRPTVTFSGGGGSGAVATASITGTGPGPITTVSFANTASHGTGYTSVPTVVFHLPAGSATSCPVSAMTLPAATAVLAQSVGSVTISNGGSNYTTAPAVSFSPVPAEPGVSGGYGIRALGTSSIRPVQTVSGRQSIDTVTVTIGGKPPVHVPASGTIQSAIDAAAPGDLIVVDPTCTSTTLNATGAAVTSQIACTKAITSPTPGAAACTPSATNACTAANPAAHNEMVIMWKPVRLQGVGAASSIINANTHPAGKINAWREQVDCLFGLSPSGTHVGYDRGCGAGWNAFTAYQSDQFNPQVDRLPLEATVGWDANLNGNLAELLQEPSLMGALEGAGITVLAKGVNFPADPFDPTLLAGFPTGTKLLIGSDITANFLVGDANPNCHTLTNGVVTADSNPFSSNYSCNPSSIDALGITDSSQGGGGIFIHGWGHNLQLANNRIYNNAGTLSGGINVGQGEYPSAYVQGAGALNAPPGSCEVSPVPNAVLPYCQNINVNIHNNYVSLNSSTGDELFSATPAGAGGVSICTGSDYYKFNYNWVCGNLSSGDGGGLGHIGFSYNGDIEHNTIIFNQSTNPTIPANGGGMIIMGSPDADLVCNGNSTLDQDCVPYGAPGGNPGNTPLSGVGPSDGVGPGLVINANLIMGNSAESGSGAGIAFQAVNGSDMVAFPTDPNQWNTVTVTNNIIANNVGGWDGAGISLLDSTAVNIINNTIVFNASTASAGPLFNTLGAPRASTPPPGPGGPGAPCTANCGTTSAPQPAGVVAIQNSAVLRANLPASVTVVCQPGHPNCRSVSTPKLENNIIWHNSSYYIGVGALSPQFQQNVVALYNAFTTSQPPNQATTGACVTASYWDIGVRGDTGPTNHGSGFTLAASDSVLTPGGSSVTGGGNSTGNPNFIAAYCDGSRTPPETPAPAARGWQVPPGISDATVPNPIFNLTPAATVDEGNNWVNLRWGPLSMTNPTAIGGANGNYGGGLPLGNYGITSGSSAAGRVTGANFTDAPLYDFFNSPRKPGGSTDAGAVRLTSSRGSSEFTLSPSIVDFGLVPAHSPTTVDQDVQVINTGNAPLTFGNAVINCAGVGAGCSVASFTIQSNTCSGVTLGAGASCVINVVFNPVSTSQAQRNANLAVTMGGFTQTVALSGHDTIATISVSPITPALTANPANTAAVTGTITVTNTMNPNTNLGAGPYIPTAITLTPLTATGTFTLGGTCAVGTPINAGGTLVPPAAGSSCTITITYTPPAGATGAALNGRVNLVVAGYGTASTNPIINANFNAN
jgi:hypothetical protein